MENMNVYVSMGWNDKEGYHNVSKSHSNWAKAVEWLEEVGSKIDANRECEDHESAK